MAKAHAGFIVLDSLFTNLAVKSISTLLPRRRTGVPTEQSTVAEWLEFSIKAIERLNPKRVSRDGAWEKEPNLCTMQAVVVALMTPNAVSPKAIADATDYLPLAMPGAGRYMPEHIASKLLNINYDADRYCPTNELATNSQRYKYVLQRLKDELKKELANG